MNKSGNGASFISEPPAKTFVPFVGRETELKQLHQALQVVVSTNRPEFILIQGDFGVGKTALVERFLAEVSVEEPSILIGRGKCAMETALNGLIPFNQLLASLTEQGVRQRAALGNLVEFAKEVAPAWIDVFTHGAASAVVKTVEESRKLLGQATFSQQNVFVQFTNALQRFADKHTLIGFLDDLHWADASSLQLLFHLARYLQDRGILFICTYRPVEAMEAGPNAALFRDIRANLLRYGATELEMHQGIDVAEYVAQRYPLNAFTSDFVAHVQKETEGYALFVSQLFSMWQETGVIASMPGPNGQPVWRLAADVQARLAIPPTLSEVVQERLRLMEERLHEMLTFASVEGEDFTAQVIVRLQQLDELEAYENLETLERRYRLIQEQEAQEVDAVVLDFYRFTHRFFREHIYSLLSAGRRRVLHRQVGECLEALYRDRSPIAGQLALHFREARESLKAARYALLAAQSEQARYAWSEAESWCESGLELLDKLPPSREQAKLRLDLLEQSGSGFFNAGRHSQADERYRAALALAQQLAEDAERIADICEKLAYTCESENRYDETMRFLQQGQQVLADDAVPFGEIHIRLAALEGAMQARFGNNELAVRALRQVLADLETLPQTHELERVEIRARNDLAVALSYMGRYSEASVAYQTAYETADRIGEKKLAAGSLLNLAYTYVDRGQLDECESWVSKALDIAQEIGDLEMVAYGRSIRAHVFLDRGKPQEAISELRQAIALSEQTGVLWNMPTMRMDLALAYLALSDLESAYEQATQGLAEAEKTPQPYDSGQAYCVLARVEAAQHNWESAAQHFEQAIALQQQAEARYGVAVAQYHCAEALLQQGERERAIGLLQAALSTFQELELAHEVSKTQHLLQEVTG